MPSDHDLTKAPARKALGQHFLFDPDILRRIAIAAGPVENRTVFEIGPGPGGLTKAVLAEGAAKVIAIEADNRFSDALRDWPDAQSGRLAVVADDARKVDYAQLHAETGDPQPAMIIANLPYNVGTPLLVGWLQAGAWRSDMALMFQKEVAERICARPGDRHYGRLAVLSQAVCDAHIAFTVPAGAFRPPPKVDSAVAVLTPLPEARQYPNLKALEMVTSAAFGQRRKMLRAALKSLASQTGGTVEDWLDSAGVDPTARAETLDQDAFRRLADGLISR